MEVKLKVRNVDLRETQERLSDNVKQVRETTRKALLAYAGLWAMAFEEAQAILERSRKLVAEAERRGEALEREAEKELRQTRSQLEQRLRRPLSQVEQRVEKVRQQVARRLERTEGVAEKELEQHVERILERLGIPSRERIVKLSQEIEELNRKLDAILAARAETAREPFPGYDTLTVKEIVARLPELDEEQLRAVRTYEALHQNRVTVLRAVDHELAGRQEPEKAPAA